MTDRKHEDDKHEDEKPTPAAANDSTKPAEQDVGPPGERVDDEVDGAGKTTKRQE